MGPITRPGLLLRKGVHSLEQHSNLGIGLPEQCVVGSLRLRRLTPLQTGIFIKGRIDLELPRAISNPGVISTPPVAVMVTGAFRSPEECFFCMVLPGRLSQAGDETLKTGKNAFSAGQMPSHSVVIIFCRNLKNGRENNVQNPIEYQHENGYNNGNQFPGILDG